MSPVASCTRGLPVASRARGTRRSFVHYYFSSFFAEIAVAAETPGRRRYFKGIALEVVGGLQHFEMKASSGTQKASIRYSCYNADWLRFRKRISGPGRPNILFCSCGSLHDAHALCASVGIPALSM